ncbi:putative RNA-binding Zn-ribbon protein involved in translation (DUF1610 family) [Paenibacillus sp. 1182]|uniref:hypothetical protein n=1 Tax=Paenibacillus sp. 1182 TaxID=2806565 RepID=UPI001AE7C201|nr:hypothetical protein [Paenibacillus sp. 1182]MBP1309106.1 putative RNA-binding Zn-ribbon protein involved in translation (DUF1610 family) [Paenibacillus sp. 1182]
MNKPIKITPWVCDNCDNKWVDNNFVTWEECPECGGAALHGSIRDLEDGDEWYTED